jgi:hypothetical protein
MTILTEKAMLAYLNVTGKSFGKSKVDKELTAENEARHGVKKGSLKSRKLLIADDFTEKLATIGRKAYEYHRENTLPWDREGGMILPAQHYLTYMATQRRFASDYHDAASEFERVYEDAVEEARDRLGGTRDQGGLFNPKDFPDRSKLFVKHPETGLYLKFSITVDIEPIPDQCDFRIELNELEIQRLQKQMDSRLQKVLTNAIGALWTRVREPIEILRDRMAGYEDQERKLMLNAWIDNVSEIVKLIPQLNLTGDPELDRICKEAEVKLCQWNADHLKVSQVTRKFVASAADDILKQMAGYCGAIEDDQEAA